jgi:hypothetical protein
MKATDKVDVGPDRQAREQIERMKALVRSIHATVTQSREVIRLSRELIERIPDEW